MKAFLVQMAIRLLVRFLLRVVGVAELHDMVAKADMIYRTGEAKRIYVRNHIHNIGHGLSPSTVNLLTEVAVFSYKLGPESMSK